MQIYEIKNNTAEILYEPDKNKLFLSDFLFIEDDNSTIVSQVTNIATTEQSNINIATVKFYLSVDKANRLTKYDGHTPSKNSDVGFLDANEIIGLFRPKFNEIIWGEYARDNSIQIATDLKTLSSGCCIVSDRKEQSIAIVKNIATSLEKNNTRFLLIDFDGKYKNIKTSQSVKYGNNFRIPLDSKALDYIFENDLNDCPIDAKAIIQGIIIEIQKYVESTDDKFIPFETFLHIILSEATSSKNSGLMIFANKLLKYKQKQIFADKKSHFSIINDCNNSIKLDLYDIDEKFHSLILNSLISKIEKKFYVIADISDENIQSETVKNIYDKQNIRLIPILTHDNKFLNKIKAYCNNIAIFSPIIKQGQDKQYDFSFEKLSNDEFILWGENTLFIPLTVSIKKSLKQIQETNIRQIQEEDISLSDLDDLDRVNIAAIKEVLRQEKINEITENDLDDLSVIQNEQPSQFVEIKEVSSIEEEEENSILQEQTIEELQNQEEITEEPIVEQKEIETIEEEEVILEENDNIISEEENIIEETEQEVIEEPEEIEETEEYPVEENQIQQNTPVELRVIQEEKKAEPVQQKEQPNPNKIPVYEPKETDSNENQVDFEEGCRVSHAKYGIGTIEKIIKYGKKTLCSIQFDQVGRRLLDPNITTLEKI